MILIDTFFKNIALYLLVHDTIIFELIFSIIFGIVHDLFNSYTLYA